MMLENCDVKVNETDQVEQVRSGMDQHCPHIYLEIRFFSSHRNDPSEGVKQKDAAHNLDSNLQLER